MDNSDKIIIDLCGGTGSWSEDYARAGYDRRIITLPEYDVRTYRPPRGVWGILAAPPCTEFAVSGARWWSLKFPELLEEALDVVYACLHIIEESIDDLAWWGLENPVGRLFRFIDKYEYSFQPWEYGDPWLKRTCIWGAHTVPIKNPCEKPIAGKGRWQVSLTNHLSPKPTADQLKKLVETGMIPADWIHRLVPSPDRAMLRSITPPGFAHAFFEANP